MERCYGLRLVGRDWTSDAARLAAALTGFLVVACVPVALAADSTGSRAQLNELRSAGGSLESRANAAALELYALESELGRARGELQSLAARRARVERERIGVRKQLAIAEAALRVSERRLAELVRALYEQSGRGSDPLTVLLGADSLEEALTGLDGLRRAAGENERIVEQTRSARVRLRELDARLAARDTELAALTATAAARAQQLEASTAERKRFVAGLRRQQGLNAARIAAIETRVQLARNRSAELTAAAEPIAAPVVDGSVPAREPAAQPQPVLAGSRSLTVLSTGYSLSGHTSTGMPTAFGVVAVDPTVIPLGTRLTIPGYGVGVAADTGGAVRGNMIDLWFPTRQQALAWGRRTITVTLG